MIPNCLNERGGDGQKKVATKDSYKEVKARSYF